jgi:hypothetical protein
LTVGYRGSEKCLSCFDSTASIYATVMNQVDGYGNKVLLGTDSPVIGRARRDLFLIAIVN